MWSLGPAMKFLMHGIQPSTTFGGLCNLGVNGVIRCTITQEQCRLRVLL